MSASLLFATRFTLATRRALMPSSALYKVAFQPKTTFQYEYDKPFAQRHIEKKTKKIQEYQKFLAVSFINFVIHHKNK
jgi:hypothetical protein